MKTTPSARVRAALDMIKRTTHLGERSTAFAGSPLMLHVGINTGHVVAGGFGAGAAKSYSVTGDTVNTAQRLQSMAAPGRRPGRATDLPPDPARILL